MMRINPYGVFFLVCYAATHSLGGAQEGFVSIDCGLTESSSYTNDINLKYVSDDGFAGSGTNKQIDPNLPDIPKMYRTVRAFPDSTRNCYYLPATVGKKYVIRASFMYGNYDGLNTLPSFELYFGVDLWDTIKLQNSTHMLWTELIAQAAAPLVYVCLVKTGTGIPFISGLELRPLADSIYSPANSSQSLTTFMRIDVGATRAIRYPDDDYDRIWVPDYNSYGTPYSTNLTVIENKTPFFGLPSAVMQTAVYASKIEVSWSGASGSSFHVFLESADLIRPGNNQTRQMKTLQNGGNWCDPYAINYLQCTMCYSTQPVTGSQQFTLQSVNQSDYGAVLNAFEVYKVNQLSGSSTDGGDVDAIKSIKDYYQLKKNWVGDPCLPQNSPWDGLTCSSDNSARQRIVSLDLSNSGLNGVITDFFSKLTNLRILNLSRNNLHGSVPSFLQQFPNFINVDLSSNNLSGSIPSSLQERVKNGGLVLSIDNNPQICKQDPCDQGGKNHRKKTITIVLSVVASLVALGILLSLMIFIMRLKSRKQDDSGTKPQDEGKGCNFSYDEVVEMTNDFQRIIGKGGSGNVFYGRLKDGCEVAVKIIKSVSQGIKEYTAEVKLLTKVHHKYLVSFVGFCNEDKNMILVYEYMNKGNLRQLLSDETGSLLSWKQRLQIALSAAIGLEYLHSGCRPPIIHRDVKSSNILLNENLEAKIADFGLSKMGVADEITHMSTKVAGTPGYIDPEYYNTDKLTQLSDVYSFGVVLFEIITGHHAIFILESSRLHILQWVTPKIVRGEVSSIIDPRLQGRYNINSAWKVAETALACASERAITRPSMTEVVNELKEAIAIETYRVRGESSSSHKSDDFI